MSESAQRTFFAKEASPRKPRKDNYHLPEEQTELSPRDHDLIRTLQTITRLEGTSTFTSDTFRKHGLDRFIDKDKQHGIGGFFAKLKSNGYITQEGWARSALDSNHGRAIRVWKWKT